jgi:hypothetical protein
MVSGRKTSSGVEVPFWTVRSVVEPLGAPHLIEQAELTLEEASGVIANGYLRLDPQEWIRAVEKRRAAVGGE